MSREWRDEKTRRVVCWSLAGAPALSWNDYVKVLVDDAARTRRRRAMRASWATDCRIRRLAQRAQSIDYGQVGRRVRR